MSKFNKNVNSWLDKRVKNDEIYKYLDNGKSFMDESQILNSLTFAKKPDSKKVADIMQKSLAIQTLTLDEVATLINVSDRDLLAKMAQVALKVKKKVYDNRIVVFGPLYLGNFCVNDCLYCGFRQSNSQAHRRVLTLDEIKSEAAVLCGKIGHKRLIVVYGEHPSCDIGYMVNSIKAIYDVKAEVKNNFSRIRRVNVNAPPLSLSELKKLKMAGIGTYQVFQETYHEGTYGRVHPENTIKSNYLWRLYSMHRAFESGIDDVGLGALFGLYDWKFEVMGLAAHNRELEKKFGVGAHTISFPRLELAANTPYTENPKYRVLDQEFKKLITIIRLAVPHTGMIVTCRESAKLKSEVLSLGITQTDASTKIGIGSYSNLTDSQDGAKQQFILGDTRTLDEVVYEFSQKGYITSFCTAGYRCGRTGKCIMDLLRDGTEGKFCKLNAVLTFREWVDDFASVKTKQIAEKVIENEINEIKCNFPGVFSRFIKCYERVKSGERDIYF